MKDIETLQKKVYGNVFNFPNMNREDKILHIELLEELIEKQQIFYKRLSLSDDPKAKEIRKLLWIVLKCLDLNLMVICH